MRNTTARSSRTVPTASSHRAAYFPSHPQPRPSNSTTSSWISLASPTSIKLVSPSVTHGFISRRGSGRPHNGRQHIHPIPSGARSETAHPQQIRILPLLHKQTFTRTSFRKAGIGSLRSHHRQRTTLTIWNSVWGRTISPTTDAILTSPRICGDSLRQFRLLPLNRTAVLRQAKAESCPSVNGRSLTTISPCHRQFFNNPGHLHRHPMLRTLPRRWRPR